MANEFLSPASITGGVAIITAAGAIVQNSRQRRSSDRSASRDDNRDDFVALTRQQDAMLDRLTRDNEALRGEVGDHRRAVDEQTAAIALLRAENVALQERVARLEADLLLAQETAIVLSRGDPP